jgi:hypothetical protein
VYGSKPFDFFWLKDDTAVCALCGTTRMWTFIITPIASLVVTVLVTTLDITLRGEERARKPLIVFPNDRTADNEEEEDFEDDKPRIDEA